MVRSFLAIANKNKLHLKQLNVETAFLYGEIDDDIYNMEIPEGITGSNEVRKNNFWKLQKSLYGFKISPKKWNDKFTQMVEKLGFRSNCLDPCLFMKSNSKGQVFVLLYVDDILIMGDDESEIKCTINKLNESFVIKNLGQPKEFLGIKIERDERSQTLILSQEKFITNMLKKFGFENTHPVATPMVTSQVANRERKLREQDENNLVSVPNRLFREVVGSLLYLANCTRPDISYAVNVLSRHQIDPSDNEWNMATRVMQYLSGSKQYGLTYRAKSDGLVGYSDSSLTDCKNSLTTCGFVIKMFGDTVAWRTHIQKGVALSTCQAEYVAMSEACQEMMSIHNSVKFVIGQNLYPMNLFCDNMAALVYAETDGGNKLRYMVKRRYHYVKEYVRDKYVKTSWIPSKKQLADIFTKSLEKNAHNYLTDKIINKPDY